ncbi:MAG: hypothetical protein OEL53_15715 [Rhodospirillales bacterium]|nr:hypothetical protein [Rhodospirillales bacterium]
MERQEEGHQPDHIAMVKAGYMKDIPDCVAKGKPAAAAEAKKSGALGRRFYCRKE